MSAMLIYSHMLIYDIKLITVMKFKVLFAIVSIFLLGCKSTVAVKYNDIIVEQQNKLKAGMDEAEPRLKNYFITYQEIFIRAIS